MKGLNCMNARTYLSQLKRLEKLIDNKIKEKEQYQSMALSITPQTQGERVQATSNQQKMADAVARYVDLEREIEQCIDQLIAAKREIITTLEQVENALQYTVLYKHYVEYKEFTIIAAEEHYSYAHILWVHKNGLIFIQNLLESYEIR